ncbi:acyltransferase ChoActase/COT/CPT [Basidiobolus meristosporus CBS 931.73]|uniref:Carnitine O-acetyltransferase, mitochondrial n=1 Tax=Basidiobolus meristosporus CBS 931.73 TaxID=1314790 RepID=A0A1Y1YKQ5_9FUNG|nr:acyltransferase ChoActase/COT/CPT [Basidiobolus meristosporus CBS 931.73]|eukprot:ORX98578.1 acyltransferase ChoActase/COT/CPT [Basidiobolus meristosporus CBS 931.73]
MYRYQSSIPKLPVPKLEDTCQKYLKSVRPLLDDQAYANTELAVKDFLKPGGQGEELQKRLLAKANDPKVVNWLEDWWNDLAYMGYRDPVVPYVSYFYTFKDDLVRKTPSKRAASIVTAAMEFRELVVSEKLTPDGSSKAPFCMSSYKYMFNACRYPKKPSDYAETFDTATNTHIGVVRKNKYYIVEMFPNGQQLSAAELEQQFERIIADAGSDKAPALGAVTCDSRDVWADVRPIILQSAPENEALLKKLESSILLVCLDDSAPQNRDELSWGCWAGDGRNRYFDKSLQFIVFENGRAGFLGEHSCMDGTPTARLCDYILSNLAKGKVNLGSNAVRSNVPNPEKLNLRFSEQALKAIAVSEKNFDVLMSKHDLNALAYYGFGKNLIKKFRTSPDAFVQMIIQLGYYKMHGICHPTYEAATTRKFAHGRTETGRSVSSESVAFVKAMEDPTVSKEQKIALGRAAFNAHVKYMVNAGNAQGVDRHLLGLRLLLRPNEPKPAIFQDKAYSYSSHWNLSTSQLASEFFDSWGYGEVVPDGFGIAYIIKNNALHFTVTSMNLGAKTLTYCLAEAAEEMKKLFESEVPTEKNAKAKL